MPGASMAITGVSGPVVVSSNPFTGQHTVSVDGRPIPREKGGTYQLPSTDGGSIEAKVSSSFFDPAPTLEVAGKKYASAPPLPAVLRIMMLLPFALVFVGGLLGGVIGALGVGVNTLVARRDQSTAVKAMLMVGVLIAAILIWSGAVQVIGQSL